MIRSFYINDNNDLLGVLSVRAINTLKVCNKKELEERKEEILQNIKRTGGFHYGKKTSFEILRFFNLNPAMYIEGWEDFKAKWRLE